MLRLRIKLTKESVVVDATAKLPLKVYAVRLADPAALTARVNVWPIVKLLLGTAPVTLRAPVPVLAYTLNVAG